MKYVHVEYWYWNPAGDGHKKGEAHMREDNFVNMLENSEVITANRRKLAGYHYAAVEDRGGRHYVFQLGGYNGNIGMFNYIVNPDNTLTRTI